MYADCNLNPVLVLALAEAILEGNDIHRELLTSGAITHVNLTIPEALEGAADSLVGLTEWVTPNINTLKRIVKSIVLKLVHL